MDAECGCRDCIANDYDCGCECPTDELCKGCRDARQDALDMAYVGKVLVGEV